MERGTQATNSEGKFSGSEPFSISAQALSLPKGDGATRWIGEKFAANPVTGAGSMNVPIATSPGQSGVSPQLSLSYDSGAGNGACGFGWSLSPPAITRKTDKGFPQYRDAEKSDAFLLSGAEDLVPVLNLDGDRFEDDTTVPDYTFHGYRPCIEGLFARDVHWHSISKENVLTLYGRDNDSRIAAPEDSSRIFSWLIVVAQQRLSLRSLTQGSIGRLRSSAPGPSRRIACLSSRKG